MIEPKMQKKKFCFSKSDSLFFSSILARNERNNRARVCVKGNKKRMVSGNSAQLCDIRGDRSMGASKLQGDARDWLVRRLHMGKRGVGGAGRGEMGIG